MTRPLPLTVPLVDETASDALGVDLAKLVLAAFGDACDGAASTDGLTLHLSGGLGAGKTTVVRALLRRLGVGGRIKSPTYALVEPYVVEMPQTADASVESRHGMKLNCYHFDFFRFENPHEWIDAGFRDYFSDAALRLVEWPERAVGDGGSLLPAPDVAIVLTAAGTGRVATIGAGTVRGAAWLTRFDIGGAAAS